MWCAEISIGEFGCALCTRSFAPARRLVNQRLPDKSVLRVEMPVEASVGEPRGFHDIRNADAIEATLANEVRGSGQDPFAVLLHLLSTDLHKLIPFWVLD